MGNDNESKFDVSEFRQVTMIEMESDAARVRMSNSIGIIGIHEPEKLAEGNCPSCHTMVDLWATNQGLELSLHKKGYNSKPVYQEEQKCSSAQPPIIIDTQHSQRRIPFSQVVVDYLLLPIPCSINVKKSLFFTIIILGSVALLIQTAYLFWPAIFEPRILLIDNDLMRTAKTMGLIACALIVINFIAYKVHLSDSGANQIDEWIFASSILIIAYYIASNILLPVIWLYHLNLPLSELL